MNTVNELIESLPLIKTKIEELKIELSEISWSRFIDKSIRDDEQRIEDATAAYSSERERLSDNLESLSIAYEEGRKQKAIRNALSLIK